MRALLRILTAARAGAVTGILLGFFLAVVTAFTNGFHTLLDTLRLAVAVGLVFGGLLGAVGLLGGVVATIFSRGRPGPVGAVSFAACASLTTAVWLARWFEFNRAYPRHWPFVDNFAGMLGVALGFAGLLAVAAVALAIGLTRAATGAGRLGVTSGRVASVGTALLLAAAGALALRADPAAGPPAAPTPARPDGATDRGRGSSLAGPLPAPNDRRVLVIGCDGAEWSVIDALLAEGELPNLRRLADGGVRAPLRTIEDRPSPSLWTSIASSRRPADSGIFDFYVQNVFGAREPVRAFPRHFGLNAGLLLRDVLGRRAVAVTPVSSGMVRARRLWEILGSSGVEVGVVGWLVTWPARAGDASFVVSDRAWAAAAPARAAGESFSDPGPPGAALWDPPGIADRLPRDDAAWTHEDAWTAAFAERLIADRSPQVLLAYFRDVDAAEHLAWDEWEPRFFRGRSGREPRRGPVREGYLRFDRSLGRLLEAFGEDATVILVSDHGHGPWFTWLGRGTPGGHTDAPDGVFVAAGPGILAGAPEGFAPSVYDVAPTVLRLVGLPSAADMEGSALSDILADAVPLPALATYQTGDPPAGEAVPSEADEAMMERLRALGYLR